MKYRRLGNTGLQVSEISLGSWLTFGSSIDARRAQDIVTCAYECGVNLFDTADVYANGRAEEVLGRGLSTIPRHHVVLASKCFFPMSERPNDSGLSRKHIFESVHASLRRLGTDYLDLHQCHRFDPDTPLDETLRAYEDLIRQGKVLHFGVSEWSAAEIRQACLQADKRGGYRPISNQPQYSILRRQLEHDVLATSVEYGLGQIVFSPLGQGVLTGKYSGEKGPSGARAFDDRHNQFMGAYMTPASLARVEKLRPIAESLDLSMAQLALAWCLRQPGVSSVIIGATKVEQVQENCRAAGVVLPDEVVQTIDRLFPAN